MPEPIESPTPAEAEYAMLGAWLIARNLMGRTQVEMGHHREVIDKVWTLAFAAGVAETERRIEKEARRVPVQD